MKKVLATLSLLMVIGVSAVFAQTKAITGTVTGSEDGEPIPGATVFVKGTTVGTVTLFDGTYSLNVPADAQILVFSFIGMETQEIEVAGRSTINVALASSSIAMDEVIVVAYGTSTKGSFTGSAAVLGSDKLEKRQVANISNALSGTMAGVQILSSNGQPGESADVRIRGVGSINAEMDPLYVVDGVPFDGDLSSLSSSDIESMTVLKDAASTALYGARGANGIIMITTKKGSKGKTNVSLDAKVGVNSRAVKNYEVLTSPKNYIENVYQAIYNAGIYNLNYSPDQAHNYANVTIPKNAEGGIGYRIYTVPQGQNLIGLNGKLNPNATLGYSDADYYYHPDNWADETFKNNKRQEYNLSITGGSEQTTFYMSLGYLDDQGVIDGSGFTRYTGRLKADHKVNDWLKVGANVGFTNILSDYPGEQVTTNSSGNAFFIANYIAPVYPLYVRDAATKQIKQTSGRNTYDYGTTTSTNFSRSFMSISNPSGDLLFNKTEYIKDIVNTTAFAEFTPFKGFKFLVQYGINVDNTKYNDLGNAYMGQSASYGGTAYQDQTRILGVNQQYIANYHIVFQELHNLDFTVGYDGYSNREDEIFASGENLYHPEKYYVSNAIDNLRGGGSADFYATKGIIGRANYSYNDTYFANLAYRRDGSSRFHPDKRWGNFWSASAAWMISNEEFMRDFTWIDMLKLKGSYGEQGNDLLGSLYAWQDEYRVTGADGVFSDGALDRKGNPDITWETSISYNVGFDIALFKSKLTGSIEYFSRESSNMLYLKPTNPTVGYPNLPMNIGSMTNSGLEVDLNYNILKTSNINWGVYANASFIKNKINELHPDLGGIIIDGTRRYEEGYSMYRMNLVKYAGVYSKTGAALYWAKDDNGREYKTTDWQKADNTNKVGTSDLLPKVYGGFGTSVDAYGFDFSVQLAYQLGGQIYDSGYARLMHGGSSSNAGNNWHKDIYKAWTPENTTTDVPRLNANDRFSNSTSTRFLVSSNYLSLNNITLGYTLPKSIVDRVGVSRVRVYCSADNVALLTNRVGLDPRQSYTSATTARYTPIRTVSGGINVAF